RPATWGGASGDGVPSYQTAPSPPTPLPQRGEGSKAAQHRREAGGSWVPLYGNSKSIDRGESGGRGKVGLSGKKGVFAPEGPEFFRPDYPGRRGTGKMGR